MKKMLLLLTVSLFAFSSFAQQGAEPMKVTDMLKIKTPGSVSLSRDGSKAVFTLLSIEPDGDSRTEYKYVSQIWMVATDGSRSPWQLTSKENSSQPVISPDGKKIVFSRAVDGKSQLFLLSLDGGEAIQLTRFRYGASGPRWSPDGKQILFSASISLKDLLRDSVLNPGKMVPSWPFEKPGLDNTVALKANTAKPDPDGNMEEIRAYLEADVTDKKAKVVTKLNLQDETDVNPDMSFVHLFMMDAVPDAKPTPVTHGFFNFTAAEFTPDGRQLIVQANLDSSRHPDRVLEGQIYLVNTDGSNLRKLLADSGINYGSPRLSPSGQWLAFQYSTTSFVSVPALAIMPLNGSAKNKMDIPFDRSKGNLTWSADEKYIYFTAQSHGGQPLYRADITSKKVEALTDENSGILNFDLQNGKIVFVKTEINSPFEVFLSDLSAKNAQRISHFNTEWIQNKKLSFPEKRTFRNEKGMDIEYWVMKPTHMEPGQKYPLLLEIHGGPTAMWGPGESTMWHEYQYFCSRGYGVVYCNPRGSGGYGIDFLRGNINDWGTGPTKDVLTSLDKTIAAENWVDTSKLLVTGGSYAGYLVAWIVGHDHRFKAACSQRGVYDLSTFFGEGNAWRLVPNYFGGYPWEPAVKTILERESPINYVQNITTPYIIFHGENDRRTGFIEGEMLYRSLKVLGRPVEYVRHPGATHEITRSGNNRQRIDQLLRTYEFFERWIH